MQTWVALPRAHEETAPAFFHHPAASLPQQRRGGVFLRVIAGRGFGEESPVQVFADTYNVALDLAPEAELSIDDGHAERAVYVLDGELQVDGADIPRSICWCSTAPPAAPAREDAGQGDAARRRTAGRPAPPVVELRVQLERAHRAGQGGLAGRLLRHDSRRRCRIHPAAPHHCRAQAGGLPLTVVAGGSALGYVAVRSDSPVTTGKGLPAQPLPFADSGNRARMNIALRCLLLGLLPVSGHVLAQSPFDCPTLPPDSGLQWQKLGGEDYCSARRSRPTAPR
jgi:hypothetical protein